MELATLLSLINTIAIILAGIFAAIQLLQIKQQRGHATALQMLNSAQTSDFMEGINIIYNLPGDLSKEEIEDRLGEKFFYLLIMFARFESLGLLVFRREIKLELVKDFIGGPIIVYWRTTKNYFLETREKSKNENYGEWVQWLAEQLEKTEIQKPKKPAYIAHKNWKNR